MIIVVNFPNQCRFDGIEFKTFQHNESISGSIGQGWINSITCTPDNQLWFAIAGQGATFMRFDYETENFIDYSYALQDTQTVTEEYYSIWKVFSDNEGKIWLSDLKYFNPDSNKITEINNKEIPVYDYYESKDGKLWLASTYGIIFCYNKKTKAIKSFDLKTNPDQTLTCYSILQDLENSLWIGTQEGLIKVDFDGLDKPNITRYQHNPNNPNSLSDNLIYDIIEDKNNNLIIATVNGLNLFDKERSKFHRYFYSEYNIESINSNLSRMAYRDKHNNIWLATDNGVAKIQEKNFTSYEHSEHRNSITHNKIQDIIELPDKTVWLASPKGIDVYNPQLNTFEFFTGINQANGLIAAPITFDASYPKGILIGTWGDGAYLYNLKTNKFNPIIKKYIKIKRVFAICVDSNNRIWYSLENYGVVVVNKDLDIINIFRYDNLNDSSLCSSRLMDITEDSEKNIWIATNNGLNKLVDYNSGTFKKYFYGNTINCLFESTDKYLWIGMEKGLARFNIQTDKYQIFDENDDIAGHVYSILEDNTSNIWISTSKGLAKCNLIDDSIIIVTKFREEDGLNVGHFLPRSCTKLADGTMLYGGTKGFCKFHPNKIEIDTICPDIVFTNLKIGNRDLKVGEEINNQVVLEKSISSIKSIVLNHKNNAFSITFAGLQYNIPQYNQYCYRLDGYDMPIDDWKHTNAIDREVEYMNLPGGDYTFKVKAANSFGTWNPEPAILNIKILPPWWQTLWFRGTSVLLTILLIIIIIRSRTILLKRQKQKLQYQVNKQTKELKIMNQMLSERKEELEVQMHELAKMNEELKAKSELVSEMAKKIHETDQSKLRFFANISHEFRTPLTLIIGPLEKFINIKVLQHINEWEYINHYLRIAHKNAKRLSRLVNQILDFRKIDQKAVHLKISNNNILEFINEVVAAFNPLAESRGVQLKVKSEESKMKNEEQLTQTSHSSLITQFWFDADVLEKILYNLISNAIKYTPEEGEILITIGFVETRLIASLQNQLVIKITDTGIGIKPENLDKIFDRFYHTEGAFEKSTMGTGIGLAYTHELVKLHKGEIKVKSTIKKGTTFILQFPLGKKHYLPEDFGKRIENNELSYIRSMIDSDESKDLNNIPKEKSFEIQGDIDKNSHIVLLVEDNIELRTFVKSELAIKYKILEANNGVEGLQVIAKETPDLIISDIMMPEMDGIEFSKKIMADENTSHIPIILLTAKDGEENILKGLKTGAGDYIIKPFNIDILKIKIQNLFDLRKNLQDKFNNTVSAKPSDIAYSYIDEKFLEKAIEIVNENMCDYNFNNDGFVMLLGQSRAFVYKKIKALTGQTLSEFIRCLRLKAGAKMLLEGNKNISQVSYQVGFKHASEFSLHFRKLFNKTPKQYMKEGK